MKVAKNLGDVERYTVNQRKISSENIMLVVCAVIILGMYVCNICKIHYPYIIDEIGYWGVAASLNGYDWTEVMANVPYYSYGYSFIIAILLKILKNSVLVYKMQIVINGIFMVISFLLAYDISKKLFKEIEKKYLLLATFTVTVYSGHLVLCNTGLTEALLILLCWINLWLVYKYADSGKIIYMVCILLLSAYAYTVHQRMLAMLAASAVVILLKNLKYKKINWKKLCIVTGIVAVAMIFGILLKNILIDNVWSNTDEAYRNINDYNAQFNKIKGLLNPKTLLETIQELLGLVFYIGTATFGVAYIGIGVAIKKAMEYFKGNKNNLLYIYVGLLFLGLLGISTIYYSAGIDRADQAVYGRYIEVSYGIILLLGFCQIYNFTKRNIYFVLTIPYWLIMGWILDRRIARYGVGDSYSEGSAVALAFFYKDLDMNFKNIALVISGVTILILILLILKKRISAYVVVTGIMMWFIVIGSQVRTSYVYERESDYEENYSIIGMTEEINSQLPIYCLDYEDGKSKTWMNYIQFELFDKKIEVATTEEILSDNAEKFVITSTKNNLMRTLGLGENYDLIAIGEKYTLYISKGSSNDAYAALGNAYMDAEGEVELPLQLFNVSNGKYDDTENVLVSFGKKGRFLRGFKQTVYLGMYKYKYDIKLLEHNTEEVGRFVIYVNSERYKEIPVIASEFGKGILKREILCEISQESVLEVVLELNEGSIIEVSGVKIE